MSLYRKGWEREGRAFWAMGRGREGHECIWLIWRRLLYATDLSWSHQLSTVATNTCGDMGNKGRGEKCRSVSFQMPRFALID